MTAAYKVLIVDSNPSDRGLAALLLARELHDATIVAPADPMALAHELLTAPPNVAIIAAEHAWSGIGEMMTMIRRHQPSTAVLIYGHEADIVARVLNPGLVCDGLVRKSSAGFLSLGTLVNQVRGRGQVPVGPAPPRTASAPVAASAPATVAPSAPPAASPTSFTGFAPSLSAMLPTAVPVATIAPAPVATTAPPVPAIAAAVSAGSHEMRDIAMMFSHDLREPLQQILRLAARLEVNADGSSTTPTVPRLLESATRATDMLDGMLDYLNLAARDTAPANVDLNVCLRDALDNLRGVIVETGAEINADRLPYTVGDEYQLMHLFQNLLSNAIKFHGRERPRIRITAEPQGEHSLLKFSDNGIGIAQPFAERVFEMGQRLHTREEYPGLGIGLAICRRMVERHGGLIWVESGDASGSTFCVLLPAAPATET